MASTDRAPTFNIFIIGPMRPSEDSDSASAEDTQIGSIQSALETITSSFQKPPFEINIENPERYLGSDITRNVFLKIDTTDLGIADISDHSPSVIYEYALMHSLGIPVIVLDREGQRAPFYWRNTRTIRTDFSAADLVEKLTEPVQKYIFDPGAISEDTNPISSFYRMALVDVAASTGLATGQFYNFVRHIIMDDGPLYDGELEELVVIRPPSIQHVSATSQKIRQAVPNLTRDVIKVPTHPRKEMTIQRIGKYIYDYPTPLESLTISPRYARVLELIQQGQMIDDSPLIRKMEDRMIETYFRTLRQLAVREAGTNPRKLNVLTADEFIEAAQSA